MNIAKEHITNDHTFFVRLAVRNLACNEHGRFWDIKGGYVDEAINRRSAIINCINDRAVDGKVWVAQSGTDCDGSRYQWSAYQIPATYIAYQHELDRIHNSADGPVCLHICKADELPEAWSRDLALEAFEDGHQHIIYG